MFGRCSGEDDAVETPIGLLPAPGALDTRGLDIDAGALAELLAVDPAAWSQEAAAIEEHYARFGARLPAELAARLTQLKKAVAAA
jgi:phosphoenolpyruvate carboxykinase (GTP)